MICVHAGESRLYALVIIQLANKLLAETKRTAVPEFNVCVQCLQKLITNICARAETTKSNRRCTYVLLVDKDWIGQVHLLRRECARLSGPYFSVQWHGERRVNVETPDAALVVRCNKILEPQVVV
jgi:hypothetical protein